MRNQVIKITVFVIIVIAFWFVARKLGIFERINNINDFIVYINSLGVYQYIIFLFILLVLSVTSSLMQPLLLVAGVIWGPVIGGLLCLFGQALSGVIVLMFSRYFLRDSIYERFKTNKTFIRIQDGFERNGNQYLMFTRAASLFPYNIQNYFYSLTKIKAFNFFWISFVFASPSFFFYTFLADRIIEEGVNFQLFLLVSLLAIVTVGIPLLIKYISSRKATS